MILGINSDGNKDDYRKQVEEFGVNWRSSWQGSTSGPIPTKWGVQGWPTKYLLDAEGRIRYTSEDFYGKITLDEAIKELLAEAEAKKKETK